MFQKRVRHIGACWFGSVGADTPLIKEGRGQEAVCANMTLHLLLNKSGTKESAVMKYHEHHRREPTAAVMVGVILSGTEQERSMTEQG